MMKLLLYILISILSLYVFFCIAVACFQEKFLFYPEKLPADFSFRFTRPFTEYFYSIDNASINALHFQVPGARGVILYFHGNAGSLKRWGEVSPQFLDLGYDVLIIDYRGYGKSTGKMSEKALFSDALFVYDALAACYGENKIIVYGRSIGSGIAALTASERNPNVLILEAPLYSMKDLVQHRFPWVPSFLLRYPFRTDRVINNVTCPVYIFHGTEDAVVYYGSSEKLMQHMEKTGTLFTIKGGGHNDLAQFPGYYHNLELILKENFKKET